MSSDVDDARPEIHKGQTKIPVPRVGPYNEDTPCAWCGMAPTKPYVVQAGRTATGAGGRKAFIQPKTMPACAPCTRRLNQHAAEDAEAAKAKRSKK